MLERRNFLSLDSDGLSPLEKFSDTQDNIDPTDFHTWGCPVYILDEANQGAIGTPKWEYRSHIYIYLGHYPCHAGSVSLVLNLRTGYVNPQVYVVFDIEFSTVPYLSGSDTPPNWSELVKHSSEHVIDNEEELATNWLYPQEKFNNLPLKIPEANIAAPEGVHDSVKQSFSQPEPSHFPQVSEGAPVVHSYIVGDEVVPEMLPINQQDEFDNIETLGLRRSGWIKRQPDRMSPIDPKSKEGRYNSPAYGFIMLAVTVFVTQSYLAIDSITHTISNCYQSRIIEYEYYLDIKFDGTINYTHPLAQIYIATKANNETYILKEMLKEPDKMEFLKATEIEVASLFKEKI